jgi:uncharacterized metal-binding protein
VSDEYLTKGKQMAEKTRRQFLKGIGATALGVAAISGLSSLPGFAGSDDKSEAGESSAEESICMGDARLIFSCSGAADVGEIADRVSRKLTKEKVGKMYCMVGIGAQVDKIIETTKAAEELLAIDGCPVACASKCLKQAGFEPKVVSLAELGFAKGKSPADEANVESALSKVKDALT